MCWRRNGISNKGNGKRVFTTFQRLGNLTKSLKEQIEDLIKKVEAQELDPKINGKKEDKTEKEKKKT